MTTKMIKTAAATLFCSAALVASGVQAASTGPGLGTKTVNTITQKVWDNPSTTEKEMGVKTLQDYIVQEKEMWDYLSRITRCLSMPKRAPSRVCTRFRPVVRNS